MQFQAKTGFRSHKRQTRGGFTLIEVMVVVALIAVMSTVAASRFGLLVRREWAVRDGARGIRNTLVLAAAEARSHGTLVSVYLGSGDCTAGGISEKFYSYEHGSVCTSVELPKNIYFGNPDGVGAGPISAAGEHGLGDGDGIALPGNAVTFNAQGFVTFPLSTDQDAIYLHFREEGTGGDPRFARALTVSLLGRPSLYKWDIDGGEWDRIDRR